MSANQLSGEVGISQPTLSRWLREAGTVSRMNQKSSDGRKGRVRRVADWTAKEKLRVVVASQTLTEAELGAFLREEGLHQVQLDAWSEAVHLSLSVGKGAGRKKASPESKRIRELERELHRKDKALAETAALLVLKKKAQAIWGDEDDDTEPRNGR